MGRASVKENKTMYQIAREKMNLTRESASELLGTIPPERIERIENEKSQARPDEVLLMSEKYRDPGMCNTYCTSYCSIGQQYIPKITMHDLPQIVLQMLASLNNLTSRQNRLIEITADGKIDGDEVRDFIQIQKELSNISAAVEAMQLWTRQMLAEGKIDPVMYEALLEKESVKKNP